MAPASASPRMLPVNLTKKKALVPIERFFGPSAWVKT
jgi:hypothetical protein